MSQILFRRSLGALLTLLLIACLAATATRAEGIPLDEEVAVAQITNGGFEEGTGAGGVPQDWSYRAVRGQPTFTIDTAVVRSGGHAFHLNGATSDSAAILTQRADLPDPADGPAATNYSIRVWQKTQNLSSTKSGAVLRIGFRDAADAPIGTSRDFAGNKGTNDWTLIEGVVIVPENATAMLVELVLLDATGDVWFDDAEIVGLPSGQAHLRNGGFEGGSNQFGVPASWSYTTYRGQPTFTIDTAVVRSGGHAFHLNGATSDSAAILTQRADLPDPADGPAATNYSIRVWQKTQNLSSTKSGAVLRIGFRDAADAPIGTSRDFAGNKGTNDWTLIEGVVIVPENATAMLVELVLLDATGDVWFDDAEIVGLPNQAHLRNGGFEEGTGAGGVPQDWSYRAVRGQPTFTIDTAVVRSGGHAFHLNGATSDSAAILTQRADLPDPADGPAATNYSIRVWQKTQNLSSTKSGAVLRIGFRDAADAPIGTSRDFAGNKGTNDWTLIEGVVIVPENATAMLVELVLLDATGDVWFDDAEIVGLPSGQAHLRNGGFEGGSNQFGVPASWSYTTYRGQPTISLDNAVFRSGGHSVRLNGATSDSAAVVTQEVAVPSSSTSAQTYLMRVWQKAEAVNSTKSGAVARLSFRDAANRVNGTQIEIAGVTGTADWTSLDAVVNVPYGTTAFLIDLVLLDATGNVWFDDVELIPLPHLRNASFEHASVAPVTADDWAAQVLQGTGAAERTGDVYWEDTVVQGDVHSMMLRGDSADARVAVTQSFALSEHLAGGYALDARYKPVDVVPASGDTNGARLTLQHTDDAGVPVGSAVHRVVPNTSTAWGNLSTKFAPPADATRLRVSLELWNATGTVYWDRLTIVPTVIPATAAVHFSGLGSLTRDGQPTLLWRPVESAVDYTIEYSQDPDFLAGVTRVEGLLTTSHTTATELADGVWYARGATTDLLGTASDYGPSHKFTIRRLEAYPDRVTPNGDAANDTTLLDYRLQSASTVTLEILRADDSVARVLQDEVLALAGYHQVPWDVRDSGGVLLPDGDYRARLIVSVGGVSNTSTRSITVDALDARGYRGLENDKDWSGFAADFIDKSARLSYDYYDPTTGKYTNDPANNQFWPVQTAGYSFVMAYSYTTPGMTYYQAPGALERVTGAFDAVIRHEFNGTGSWARARGLDQNQDRFALASMADAFILIEDHIADPAAKQRYLDYFQRAAAYQVATYPTSTTLYGLYPNVDQSYAFALAAVGTILNDNGVPNDFLTEAAAVIRLNEDEIFPNGGLSYISGANPVGSYQGLIGYWGRYYELTGDQKAAELIQSTVNYYPLAYEVDGVTEHGSAPETKAQWLAPSMPMGAEVVAHHTGDGRNLMVANTMRERITRTLPDGLASMSQVYHMTLSRNLDTSHITPVKLTDQGVVRDEGIDGIRVRSGKFNASLTARKNQPTRATAVINTVGDPFSINAGGLGWAYFESRTGNQVHDRPRDWGYILPPREQSVVDSAWQEGIVAEHVTVGNDIGVQHLRFTPVPSFGWDHTQDLSANWDWSVGETWVVVEDRLIGMHSMAVKESATEVETGDHHLARSRLVFGPAAGGKLNTEVDGTELFGNYNAMGFYLDMVDTVGWRFNPNLPASGQPGSSGVGAPYRSDTHVAIEKEPAIDGRVAWGPYSAANPEDRMSYNAVFFPLDGHPTARDWVDSTENDVEFLNTDAAIGLRAAVVSSNDNVRYLILANHGRNSVSTSLPVPVPNGAWAIERFAESDTPVDLGEQSSTSGTLPIDVQLGTDGVLIYRLTPAGGSD